jgi:hypothetical protein
MPLSPFSLLPSPPTTPWPALEAIAGPCAVLAIWREYLGDTFDTFAPAFLQAIPEIVISFPCPRECGCWHLVEPAGDGSFIGRCDCRPPNCHPLTLTQTDVTPFKLNRPKLDRDLCRAFSCDSKPTEFPFPNTSQIGSWSADIVPVLFTIQAEIEHLRALISEAALRFQKPYILLAPTARSLGGQSQQLLAHAKAAFFALDATVLLTAAGTLRSIKTPGDLFAQLRPEPRDPVSDGVAHQVYTLAKAFDSECSVRKARPFTVLRLYWQGFTVTGIAKECRCSTRLILARKKWLEAKLGRKLSSLRQYSPQFDAIEKSLSYPRARKIYRKGAARGDDHEDS